MAFEDLTKRMGGEPSPNIDPDQIIARGLAADRRAQRVRDLVLGSILLAGGALLVVLWVVLIQDRSAIQHHPDHPDYMISENSPGLGRFVHMIVVVGVGSFLAGGRKLLRGIGLRDLRDLRDRDRA